MLGEPLYGMWELAMAEQGINVDHWNQLPNQDKAAWIAVAHQVRPNQ